MQFKTAGWRSWGVAVLLYGLAIAGWAQDPDDCSHGTLYMVPMRDGVHLKTRVTLPEGTGPWPVLFARTHGWESNVCTQYITDLWDEGYVVINQNVRGWWGSEGADNNTFLHDGWGTEQDGYDTIAWILAQPWCNGRIVPWGGSARGGLCNLLGASGPPGVNGEWVLMGPAEFYRSGVIYYGGALHLKELTNWLSPIGDDLCDLTLAHPTYDAFWASLDVTTRQAQRDHPVCIIAGWYDFFFQSAIDNFTSLRASGGPNASETCKLVIQLKAHGQNQGAVTWPDCPTPPEYNYRAFFDYHLMDILNGYPDLPRVAYFIMGDFDDPAAPGKEWRYAEDWPPPAAQTPLYFHNDHVLRRNPQPAGAAPAAYDFDPHDPVPTLGGAEHILPRGSFDQRPVESRPDVILFETEPLTTPVEVVGKVWVYLWAASDRVDTDFTAKLTDVYPDGKSIILCDGIIRARARDSLESHSLMTPGTAYRFPIDLWSTGIVFNRGHRIRVAISSSNYPRFDVNPNTGAPLALEYADMVTAHNTIYLDADYPSHIVLPITGPDSDGDGVADWLDAFPADPKESADNDGDGMGDAFEQRIVDADPHDDFDAIEDVLPDSDFDGDGHSNRAELRDGTDPTDPASALAVTSSALLVSLGAILLLRGAHRIRK